MDKLRIGHAYDIHRMAEGRRLILGGVEIEHEKGLMGHSDADVVYHAVAESLLGALSLGDLGTHFPDNDQKFKDIDSSLLVRDVFHMVKERGYYINNIDITIHCEAPKLKPYVQRMRGNIAMLLETDLDSVNVKATTGEKIGVIGRSEGIAAEAVVLLIK